jgi:hypothetical protein
LGDVAAIRAELAEALRADVDIGRTVVYDHVHPSPTLPAVHVAGPVGVNFHPTYSTGADYTVKLVIEVARQSLEQAQRALDRWMSKPGPLPRLEQYDADTWADLHVTGISEPRALGNPDAGETASLAVDVTLELTT